MDMSGCFDLPGVSVARLTTVGYGDSSSRLEGIGEARGWGDGGDDSPGAASALVRLCLELAGGDPERRGKREWNPLRALIRPGEVVVLKPNLVKEEHPRDPEGWRYVTTHGSVIRAVADYVWKAMDNRGTVIVADAPQTDSSFDRVCEVTGLRDLERHYRGAGLDFRLVDLRLEEWVFRNGVVQSRRKLAGDPLGYVDFDLASSSEFVGHGGAGRYYGADYDSDTLNSHHTGGKHEYRIARTAIDCDVLFSLPKVKTHKKAGVTLALKNLVGINGDKNWLPHHTEGLPSDGGDERPSGAGSRAAERTLVKRMRTVSESVPVVGPKLHAAARSLGERIFGSTEEVVRSGNWYGNDTLWRMCLDLNKIAAYGRVDGTMPERPIAARRHYALADGIVAGEGNGPMNPDPVNWGVVAFSTNPACLDAACSVLMGFDPDRIPVIANAFRSDVYPLVSGAWQDVEVKSNEPSWCGRLGDVGDRVTTRFKPHFGWRGHIEWERGKSGRR